MDSSEAESESVDVDDANVIDHGDVSSGKNTNCKDSDWEDESLLIVELAGIIEEDWIDRIGTQCRIVGIDTDAPLLQLDRYVFVGEYKDVDGTAIIFEPSPNANANGASPPDSADRTDTAPCLRYHCHTAKRLCMKRTFLNPIDRDETTDGIVTNETIAGEPVADDAMQCTNEEPVQIVVPEASGRESDTGTIQVPTEKSHVETTEQTPEEKFELELAWCIQQLEKCHSSAGQRPTKQEADRVLRVLRNSKAPLVKKRHAMSTTFGDYRKKMAAEENQFNSSAAAKMTLQVVCAEDQTKFSFLKRSSSIVCGKTKPLDHCPHTESSNADAVCAGHLPAIDISSNSFRFNFDGSAGVGMTDSESSTIAASLSSDAPKICDGTAVDTPCSWSNFKPEMVDNSYRFNFASTPPETS